MQEKTVYSCLFKKMDCFFVHWCGLIAITEEYWIPVFTRMTGMGWFYHRRGNDEGELHLSSVPPSKGGSEERYVWIPVFTGMTGGGMGISSFNCKKVWGADAHQRSKEDQTEN
jgi:hypothetical protein